MAGTILFRVDGGRVPKIGLGHLYRCLVLADLLRAQGCKVLFLMRRLSGGLELAAGKGVEVSTLPARISCQKEREAIIKLCREFSVSTLVFDLVDSAALLDGFGPLPGVRTAVIDEFDGRFSGIDVLVDSRLWAQQARTPCESTLQLLGPAYQVIDQSWSKYRKSEKEISDKVRVATVCMGGADPKGLTMTVASQVADFAQFEQVNIVFGPAARVPKKTTLGPGFEIYHGPENFPRLVASSDLLITSGGRTPYEAASIGMPMVIVPTIEHERLTARAFSGRGLALAADLAEGEALDQALMAATGSSLRESLSKRCLSLKVGEKVGELLDLIRV